MAAGANAETWLPKTKSVPGEFLDLAQLTFRLHPGY